ncbi:ferritin-like domain-containing protein [Alkalihalobacillus sp. CinArs1]|uniref:ferritin-like domain-containing protein n=1 Tax=Alkalihalobacillus sp. CinArs1 TaxID=2995314 RepID=UPI0022DE3549|nr:ferritin-like domain-containing protein [Alkalihalobacillus sp. CinArs1]
MHHVYRTLVEDIATAINGEYSAIQCYDILAQLAPNEKTKDQILEIRQDEVNHYQAFTTIYTQLTGQQHSPQLIEECPTSYISGLKYSIEDEQKAVDFYLDIADQTQDSYIKEVFKRAAADEQNHAVWFLYFLTRS